MPCRVLFESAVIFRPSRNQSPRTSIIAGPIQHTWEQLSYPLICSIWQSVFEVQKQTHPLHTKPALVGAWLSQVPCGSGLVRKDFVSGNKYLLDVPAPSRTSPFPQVLRQTGLRERLKLMWERTCPRRLPSGRLISIIQTGLFADESAPTGALFIAHQRSVWKTNIA